jgi:hypothetical protein
MDNTPPFEPTKSPKKIAVAGKKGYGPSAASHLAKQAMQKQSERKSKMNESVHPDALHVSMTKKDGKPMYKVHKVGSNFADKIKPGEHLSDTELDDFSDMGGKIKHMKEARTLSSILQTFMEGRGRPRKNPDDPKWNKAPAVSKKEDDEDEDESGPERPESPHLKTEPDQHISVQLKRAVDGKDEKGGADVKFANGKTHFVKHDVAHKVLSAVDKLKPADRGKVHDHIAQSHDNLMAVHKVL